MITAILTLLIAGGLLTMSALLLVRAFKNRERAFTKITIPNTGQPFPKLDAKTLVETQPMMVGLSKTIEDAAAEAAKKLADDIESDLWGALPTPSATEKDALDAMFKYYDCKRADDDWDIIFPEKAKPKKKRKTTKKKVAKKGKKK